ncbi:MULTISPECIES: GNAT family N-acetyltransferase [Pseudomonas]|uniref:Acetyltransferase n=3 Tax=Pseudomonas TaxID=286 RepID=A0A0P9VRZ9_PSEA0|nr:MULTISPECIES: GNAT family N-acetyltransferase [Pseudomonas]KPY05311.1 hypothetical protein ALO63_200027 [Pseudomonas amygdali pv. mori]MCK1783323.1 GNAT family N-acetyltransferase [Pseudomonas emilianonis]RMT25092.1 Acetyltransferase [Pseudomonas amygdali pv. mori]RMT54161.1 hypothetical protein ALP46_200262 [Pseudomonas amygdali pv. myricae]RMV29829.1 hypothetical protein ALP14_200108 [Pseudomonas amygdali pv. myricae]
MKQFEIHQITHLPPKILALEKEAVEEGFRFITRLIDEWHSGTNRFDAPGECLMVACLNQQLIGVGGLSIDPYAEANTARLRRVYVAASSRGQHVGQALVKALLTHAALRFRSVHLSTDTPEGDSFYLHCGFIRTDIPHATHVMQLGNS